MGDRQREEAQGQARGKYLDSQRLNSLELNVVRFSLSLSFRVGTDCVSTLMDPTNIIDYVNSSDYWPR